MKKKFRLKKRACKKGIMWYWQPDWMDHFLSTGCKTRAEAEKYAIDNYDKRNTSKLISFGEFAKDFYIIGKCPRLRDLKSDDKTNSKTYIRDCRHYLDFFILPYFKNMTVQSIDTESVKNFKAHLKDLRIIRGQNKRPYSNRTLISILNVLSMILDYAVSKKLILVNPVPFAGKPPVHNKATYKPKGIFTPAELESMFPDSIDNLIQIWGNLQLATIAYLLKDTGARKGEILGLDWTKYKTKRIFNIKTNSYIEIKYLILDRALKQDGYIGTTKTGNSRAVILSKKVSDLLDYFKEKTCANDNQLMFIGKKADKTLNSAWISVAIKNVFIKLGFDTEGRKLVGSHNFRHSWVSSHKYEMDEKALLFSIGHANFSMTQEYGIAPAEDILIDYIKNGKIPIENN